jgi:hypothetical protein
VAELRGKGVRFEGYDLPGLKTGNGSLSSADQRGLVQGPEGNILSVVQLPAA